MFEITRKEAIEMLVTEEVENTNLYELLDIYADMVENGTVGYNELTDSELATQVEFMFNKIEGVRII